MVRAQAQPYIDQYGPQYKLDAIEFESLTLGTLPPTFVGEIPFLLLSSVLHQEGSIVLNVRLHFRDESVRHEGEGGDS